MKRERPCRKWAEVGLLANQNTNHTVVLRNIIVESSYGGEARGARSRKILKERCLITIGAVLSYAIAVASVAHLQFFKIL